MFGHNRPSTLRFARNVPYPHPTPADALGASPLDFAMWAARRRTQTTNLDFPEIHKQTAIIAAICLR
jgi:hypothetical protein